MAGVYILLRSMQSDIWIDIGIDVQHLVICWTRSGRRVGSPTGAAQMSHADQLIEIATEFAMDAKDDVADLRRKLSAMETAKVEIEARLHIANHALERLSSFVSVRGSDLQCQRCWINNEVTANLRPANGGPGDHDRFRCETCKSNFNLQV